MPLILASTSPRRKELLAQIGITPNFIVNPECDETPLPGEKPEAMVVRLAKQKALAVRANQQGIILAADTAVHARAKLLPKCEDAKQVWACLNALSGRRHRVHSGICVISEHGKLWTRCVTTIVSFKRLSDLEINAYVASGEGVGKAGGYALQGRAAAFIDFISGSPSGVIGLPLHETAQLLKAAGYVHPSL